MTVQIQKRKPGRYLQILLDELVPDLQTLRASVDHIFAEGRNEGFTDMEIGDFVRSKMKEHYSDRTIRRVLPDTAKHIEKVRDQNDSADNLSANEREPIIADKVTVEPVIESGPVQQPTHQQDNRSIAAANPSTEIKARSGELQIEQPIPEEPQQQQEPIRVTWDTLKEIDSYDEQYCKQLLKQVLPTYFKASSLERDLETSREHSHELASENDKLKFKFKLCIHWPKCKSKGTYKQSYNEYTDSESWLCDKHRKNLAEIGIMASRILSKVS